MFDPSLLDLLAFVPSDRAVNEYIDDTKSSWLKGKYWLGGQIKLSPNDKITEQLLNQVQQIQDEPYDAYNGAELASIWRAKRQFSQIQTAVHHFREDAKKRLLHLCTF